MGEGSEDVEPSDLRKKPRIQSLSDLIFGLALSIGALALINNQPSDFSAVLTSLLFYTFSFLVLVNVWRSYSGLLSILPVETELLIGLNILLLFTVSIEPYLFNQVFLTSGDLWSKISMLYGVDLAVMFLVLAFFNNSLANQRKTTAPPQANKMFLFDRNYDLIIAAVFFISILPVFETTVFQISSEQTVYDIRLRAFIWTTALVMGMVRRVFTQKSRRV